MCPASKLRIFYCRLYTPSPLVKFTFSYNFIPYFNLRSELSIQQQATKSTLRIFWQRSKILQSNLSLRYPMLDVYYPLFYMYYSLLDVYYPMLVKYYPMLHVYYPILYMYYPMLYVYYPMLHVYLMLNMYQLMLYVYYLMLYVYYYNFDEFIKLKMGLNLNINNV